MDTMDGAEVAGAGPGFEARLQRTPLWPAVPLLVLTMVVLDALQALVGGKAAEERNPVPAQIGSYLVALVWCSCLVRRQGVPASAVLGQRLTRQAWALVVVVGATSVVGQLAWIFLAKNLFGSVPVLLNLDMPDRPWTGLPSALGETLLIVVLAPMAEESIFRGLLFRKYRRRWGPGKALLGTSLAFGLLHYDLLGSGTFALTMVLLYVRTRTLWAPMLAHGIHNAIVDGIRYADHFDPSLLAGLDPPFGGPRPYIICLTILASSVAGLVVFAHDSWRLLSDPLPPDALPVTIVV